MSSAKTTDEAPKPDKKNAAGKEGEEKKARQTFERERGTKWTLERCQKYAKRYQSEQAWIDGSPASYKAASYWNWVDQCCAHMPKNLRLVHSAMREAASHHPAPATNSSKPNLQVVQGHKEHKAAATAPAAAKATHGNVHTLEKKSKAPAKTGSKDKKKKAS